MDYSNEDNVYFWILAQLILWNLCQIINNKDGIELNFMFLINQRIFEQYMRFFAKDQHQFIVKALMTALHKFL